jgi:hypothetical protein
MIEPRGSSIASPSNPASPDDDLGHPRGTLAIVIVFGLLFVLGWIAMYVFGFLARGAPHS